MNAGMSVACNRIDQVVVHVGSSLEDAEKLLILATLERNAFNRTHTAKILKIGIRTLQRKLKRYGYDSLASSPSDAASQNDLTIGGALRYKPEFYRDCGANTAPPKG